MTKTAAPTSLAFNRLRKDPPLPVLGVLLFYTMSIYTALGHRIDFLAAIRHQLLLGPVLAGLCIWFVYSNPIDYRRIQKLLLAIVLFFVVLVIAIPFAVNREAAWTAFFDRIVKQSLYAFFIVALVRTPRSLKMFFAVFLFSLFWVYQEAVHGLITGSLVWLNQGIQRLHGAVELYQHPNGISRISVQCLPFLLCMFPVYKKLWVRAIFVVVGLLAMLCIVYSGSRAGYVGVLVILFVWWLMSPRKILGVVAAVVVGVAALAVLPDQYKERFLSIGGQEKQGHSKEKRIEIVRDAWEIFKEYPTGVGVNSFTYVRYQKFHRSQDTHNLYLQVATHIGFQGVLIFGFFCGSLLLAFSQARSSMNRLSQGLRKLYRYRQPEGKEKAAFVKFHQDVEYVKAFAKASLLWFVWLLSNGPFAHTLYHIDWWLASGLAMCLLNISNTLEKEFDLSAKYAVADRARADEAPGSFETT